MAAVVGAVVLVAGCGDVNGGADKRPRLAVSDTRASDVGVTIRDGPDRTTSGSLPQTNGMSVDVKRWLSGAGYVLKPPKAVAEAISADDAIVAAQREYGSSGATGVTVERLTVTTPDLGRLVNPGDPESAVIPRYDHRQMWVVAFDVMVLKNGLGGPQVPREQEEPNPLVPGTAVVFVDAITGAAPSAIF